MMEEGTNPRLDTIRKLLAKAEDPAVTEPEREAFNKKAFDLIARYGIDQALLADRAPEKDRVGARLIDLDQPYALEKSGLLWAIASSLRCQGVRHSSRSHHKLHLYGMVSDLDRVELLYTSLLVQVSLGLATARPMFPGENVAAYRRTWIGGFAKAVFTRLQAAEEYAAAQHREGRDTTGQSSDAKPTPSEGASRSLALVFADRNTRVGEALAADYPKTSHAPKRKLSGSGGRAGFAAGQRADLGGSRLGANGNRSISR